MKTPKTPTLARHIAWLGAVAALVLPPRPTTAQVRATDPDEAGRTIPGELVDPALCGRGVVETMEEVVERDRAAGNLEAVFIPRPVSLRTIPPPGSGGATGSGGGTQSLLVPNAPNLTTNYIGPRQGDTGANSIPPDTHGAVGLSHFVAVVNTNISVYVKGTGQRVLSTSIGSFFGAGAGGAGDPRCVFDPQSQRFVIVCSDFTSKIFLAVSATSDPTGAWFKTNITVSAGTDAGHWPDYPTLGVDANGIYSSAFMVGGANTMSIFAINKAPLVGSPQSLGTVTAFRALPYEDCLQPAVTWGTAPGEYYLSTRTSTTLRGRRVNPPLTAPTLTELGNFAVQSYGSPPAAAAPGGALLDTLDGRLINVFFRNGSLWATHGINSGGRCAARWYQLNPSTMATVQQGTVNDASKAYLMPSICADNGGSVVLGFSGCSSTSQAASYYSGRSSADPAGQMSAPLVLKAGESNYDNNPGGVSRWGDYSNTSCDPVDDSLWTIQEYARAGNTWGNWIGRFAAACVGTPDCNGNGVLDSCDLANGTSQDINGDSIPDECQGLNAGVFCAGDGADPNLVFCPCLNFGDIGHGCGNSVNALGAQLVLAGLTNPDSLSFTVSGMPPSASLIFVKGTASSSTGVAFGDGLRCVAGSQIRFGSQFAQSGQGFYPDIGSPSISATGGTPPGSGLTAYYQVFYRNPDPTFCTAGTFNMSNGLRITW